MYHAEENNPERVTSPWIARDMPMCWEMLVENLSDPAHVPFSHHGVLGARTGVARPMFDTMTQFSKRRFSVAGPCAEAGGDRAQKVTKEATDMQLPTAFKLLYLQASAYLNPQSRLLIV